MLLRCVKLLQLSSCTTNRDQAATFDGRIRLESGSTLPGVLPVAKPGSRYCGYIPVHGQGIIVTARVAGPDTAQARPDRWEAKVSL